MVEEKDPSPEELESQAASIMAHLAEQLSTMVPRIDDAAFPEKDREQVDTILLLMGMLNSLIDRFTTDIELLDYADAHRDVRAKWGAIACRDAAMALYDFGDALKHLKKALRNCVTLRTPALERSLDAVIDRYKAAFPDAAGSRHVAAHPAEHVGTPDMRKRNSLARVPILISLGRIDRRVTSTRHGREVSFEISLATIDTLKTVRDAVFAAFKQ